MAFGQHRVPIGQLCFRNAEYPDKDRTRSCDTRNVKTIDIRAFRTSFDLSE